MAYFKGMGSKKLCLCQQVTELMQFKWIKLLCLFAVFQEVVVTPWKGVGSDDLKKLGLVSLHDRLYLYPLLLSASWYVLLALSKHFLSDDISERHLLIDSGIFLRSGIAFEMGVFGSWSCSAI